MLREKPLKLGSRIGKDFDLCVMLHKSASDDHDEPVTTHGLVSSFDPLLPSGIGISPNIHRNLEGLSGLACCLGLCGNLGPSSIITSERRGNDWGLDFWDGSCYTGYSWTWNWLPEEEAWEGDFTHNPFLCIKFYTMYKYYLIQKQI